MRQTPYDEMARRLRDPRLVFLNYGLSYGDLEPSDWIKDEDRPHRIHLNLIHHVLGDLDLADKRVLEVGCGRAGNCAYLSRYTDAAEVIGLDPAHGNIALGRTIHHRLERISLLVGTAEEIGLAAQTLDVILSLEAAHTYSDFGQFLEEAHRLLRPDGVLCIADLWGLEQLACDWPRRERQLRDSALSVVFEEDISEAVLGAFGADDGLFGLLGELATVQNHDLVEALARGMEAVRVSLRDGSSSYRVWRLCKRGDPPASSSGSQGSS